MRHVIHFHGVALMVYKDRIVFLVQVGVKKKTYSETNSNFLATKGWIEKGIMFSWKERNYKTRTSLKKFSPLDTLSVTLSNDK